jgi:flagellar hook-basal body complex protein FliE
MDSSFKITPVAHPEEIRGITSPGGSRSEGASFADSLKEAILEVDDLQKQSEAAQLSYAREEDVNLHEVLIKIEEAEVAFKTMMQIRNKLVDAYREIMRMGG